MNAQLSPSEVKNELKLRGTTIAEWAKAYGYPVQDVYAVLSGRTRGLRGISHEIAVALGIKHRPIKSKRFAGLDLPASEHGISRKPAGEVNTG